MTTYMINDSIKFIYTYSKLNLNLKIINIIVKPLILLYFKYI